MNLVFDEVKELQHKQGAKGAYTLQSIKAYDDHGTVVYVSAFDQPDLSNFDGQSVTITGKVKESEYNGKAQITLTKWNKVMANDGSHQSNYQAKRDQFKKELETELRPQKVTQSTQSPKPSVSAEDLETSLVNSTVRIYNNLKLSLSDNTVKEIGHTALLETAKSIAITVAIQTKGGK